MWFGTGDGLNKFDGIQFKTYRHSGVQPLCNFFSDKIIEDANGNLWIGSRNGLNKYDYKRDKLEHVFPENDTLMMNKWMDVLGMDDEQHIWFWDRYRHFYNYDPANKTYATITINEGRQKFRQAFFDKSGFIWFDAFTGLCRYNLKSKKVDVYMAEYFTENTITPVNYFVKDGDGLLWIAGYQGMVCFNTKTLKQELIPDKVIVVSSALTILRCYKDFVFIGTLEKGLFRYDKKTGELLQYRHEDADNGSLATNSITSLFIDRSDNFWVGTDGFGLNKTELNSEKFPLFRKSVSANRNFSSNFIKCFYEDSSGRLWIGTYTGGINILDRKRNSLLVLKKESINGNSISGFIRDNFHHLLIASDEGIEVINEKTLIRNTVPFGENPAGNAIRNIPYGFCKTKEGFLLVGTNRGLYQAVYKNGHPFLFKPVECAKSLVLGAVFQTTDGRVWASAIQGGFLHVLKFENGEWTQEKSFFRGMNINSFYEDKVQNILWMGSDNGLINYDLKTGNSTFINEQHGLQNNHIYGLLCDSKGKIWVSTNKGLSCYDPSGKQFRNYDVDDGLQSNEFNTGAFFKSTSGELFFGGINGFNAFYPENVKDNPNRPIVELCHLMINDEETKTYGNPSCIKYIELAYSENTLSFDFSALEFTMHDKNQYRYRLVGTDREWVNAGNKHFARYSNLRPGKYRFLVMASNNDGLWSNAQQLCSIMIQPPWWRTWWAIGILIVLISISIFWIFRNVIERKLKEKQRIIEKQMALEEERNRISKDMHDDMGSGLSKIAIMSELLKGNIKDKNGVEAIDKISKTAHELVDNMSQIIWAMNPDNDHIENILGYLRIFTLDFFEDSGIKCELKFPEIINNITLTQSVRRNLFLVIKETFHNILKHSQADEIKVEVHPDKKKLKVVIKDNGNGFEIDKRKFTGNGLNNMKKRMSAINGNYEIRSEPGKGTETILKIII